MRTFKTNHHTYKKLVHIDAYRIENMREIEVLNIPRLFSEKGTLVCIEWPEHVAALIPGNAVRVSFVLNADGSRTVTYGN